MLQLVFSSDSAFARSPCFKIGALSNWETETLEGFKATAGTMV